MHCISALTVKGKNAFENQNGVTVVQALEMEPVATEDVVSDTFLHPWELEFSELYQTQGHRQLFSNQYLLAAASCNLMVSGSPLVTTQPFQTPTNPCLASTLTSSSSNPNS